MKNDTIMPHKIKLFFHLFVLLAFVAALSGCSRKTSTPPGTIVITVWIANNPYEIEWAREVVRQWNEKNPSVIVKAQPIPEGRSSEEILMASVLAGTAPDICASLSPTLVEQFRAAKALVCIEDQPQLRSCIVERVPEESLRQFISPDGHLYQVPWKCNPIMMFCNDAIFDKAGVRPPRTYSEWMKAAEAICTSQKGVYMTFFDSSITWYKRFFDFYALYIAATGGKTLLDENQVPSINNKEALQVMSFLRENFEHRYSPAEITPGDAFLNERVAVNISGPWNVAALAAEKPELRYTVLPPPVPDGSVSGKPVHCYADPKSMAIFSTAAHPEECARFLAFALSRENDAMLMKKCMQLVYRKDLVTDPAFQEVYEAHPALRVFSEAVPYTSSLDSSPRLMELFDILSMEYVDVAVRRIRPCEVGLEKAERLMKELCSEH